jgi:hypothetical protein
MINQLENLRVGTSDEIITSDQKHWKCVEGLCNFLKNQRGSLKRVHLVLPFGIRSEYCESYFWGCFQINPTQRELFFSINPCLVHDLNTFARYFQNPLQHGMLVKNRKKLIESANWNPSVAKCFYEGTFRFGKTANCVYNMWLRNRMEDWGKVERYDTGFEECEGCWD